MYQLHVDLATGRRYHIAVLLHGMIPSHIFVQEQSVCHLRLKLFALDRTSLGWVHDDQSACHLESLLASWLFEHLDSVQRGCVME